MPKLLSSTASTARRMEAVVAVFRVRLRNSALDMTRAARVGRPLIARGLRCRAPAARPAIRRQTAAAGPSTAEATSPCGHPAATIAIAHSGARYP
jgi:hypothetical protein